MTFNLLARPFLLVCCVNQTACASLEGSEASEGFVKSRQCQTHLFSFCNRVTGFLAEEKQYTLCLMILAKLFGTVTRGVLVSRSEMHGQDETIVSG